LHKAEFPAVIKNARRDLTCAANKNLNCAILHTICTMQKFNKAKTLLCYYQFIKNILFCYDSKDPQLFGISTQKYFAVTKN
jgi:hypothetical protein